MVSTVTVCEADVRRRPKCARTGGTITERLVKERALWWHYFRNSETLDIRRENARTHIAFGYGRHVCMGAPLARFELIIILEELAKRLPGLRLFEGQSLEPVEAVQFRGPRAL